MDFLSRGFAQAKDLFLSMTPGTRIVAGLLVAAIAISLFYLFQTNLSGSEEFLFAARVFSLEELQDIQEAFAKASLADYEVDGNRVRVPRGKQNDYIGAMIDHDALPRLTNDYWSKALSGSSPFESRETQQARLKYAKENELAVWIRAIRGIDWASVQYDIQEERGFPRKKVATAIVAVRPAAGTELDADCIRGIRNTVAGAIVELKPENVTIQDVNSGRSYNFDTEAAIFGADGTGYAAVKQHYEKLWAGKVRDAVSYIPGAIVVANVELDPEKRRVDWGTKLNPKGGFTSRARDLTKTSTSTSPTNQGRPGLEAQSGSIMSRGSVSREGPRSQTEETESVVEKITDRDHYSAEKASLVPKRVTVAVSIPSSYYRDVWKQRNPAPAGQPAPDPTDNDLKNVEDEVTKKVEDIAVGLLPKPEEDLKDPYPRVQVTTYQSIPAASLPAPTTTDKAITWLGNNWSQLGLGLVGLFGLVMLRSMIRSVPAAPAREMPRVAAADTLDQSEETANDTAEGEQESPPRVLQGSFGDSRPNMKEELAEMVRGNPDAAAAILKNWISNAA
jgi:flagellar M-ring protein FliF